MLPAPNSPLPIPNSSPRPGRPRSLDQTKQREICALVANGCSLADSARYVGSSVRTIRREARRDPEFAKKLRHAERTSELAPLNAVRHAAKKSWRAGVYLMERADGERRAAKNARRITITQLKKYNASLVRILKLKMSDRMLCHHFARLFNEVLDHCVYQIAAGRDPFPIPPEVTRADSWLPKPPRTPSNSAPQSAPNEVPAAPHKATSPIHFGPPSKNGISLPIGWPSLPTPPANEQAR